MSEELKTTPEGMTLEKLPDEQIKFYEEMGYMAPIKINGEIVGLSKFLFTFGIVCGLDETGYSYRYCYASALEAHEALVHWVVSGESEPSGYIKRKPERDRPSPQTTATPEVLT